MAQDQGSGGPPGGKGKGPGAKAAPKFGQGFEFGKPDREGGGRGGPGGKRGDRGGPGGRGGRGRDEGGQGYRVVSELPVLEKALGKSDFGAQKGPLESIVRSLRQMRLKSIDQLDLGTRGKLLTALLRVARQPKPAPSEAPAAGEGAPEAAAAEQPAAEAPAEGAAPAEAAAEGAAPAEGAPAEGAPAEGAPAEAKAPAAPKPEDKAKTYSDVLYLVGRAWRAVGETDRANTAFELSGRTPEVEKEEPAAEARPPREGGKDRPERGGERGRDRDRKGPREGGRERPERERRPRTEAPLTLTGDWQEQVKQLEAAGRTRDAARIHERQKSHAEAVRLFEKGGDLKSALRNALSQPDLEKARALMGQLKPDELQPILEKSNSYELLMEHYVAAADFDNVARLYERARQFDQAALAWERAGKLTQARKAFERARDTGNAERVRQLEVDKLLQRGDKLGAAVILVAAGKKDRAIEVLGTLPGPKAFRFLQRVKLDTEAQALADRELARADAENKPSARARWLELLNKHQEAAEAWEKSDRKDKAFPLYAKLGNVQKAAELAEQSGHRTEALAFYEKLGDQAGVERAKAMPERVKPAHRDAEDVEHEEAEKAAAAPTGEEGKGSEAPTEPPTEPS